MKHFLIFLLVSFFCFNRIAAQNNCEQSLKQADDYYSGGDYDNCIQLLEKTLNDCSLPAKKKEAAYELLAKAYLEQDNLTKAEASVYKMLKENPQYELKETNGSEDFDLLVKKFDVHPSFSIGVRESGMMPFLKSTKTYSILDNVDYNAPYQTNETVQLFSILAEYEFSKSYSANIDILPFNIYFNRHFSKSVDWKMNYNAQLSFVEIPVYLKKYFMLGKGFSTYIALGGGYLHLSKASGTADISYSVENNYNTGRTEFSYVDKSNVLQEYNKSNYEVLGGFGIGYRFKNISISIDARYTNGVNSLTNPAKRYSNAGFINDYFYVNNSILLKKYEVGLSLSYSLRNIIKKVR